MANVAGCGEVIDWATTAATMMKNSICSRVDIYILLNTRDALI